MCFFSMYMYMYIISDNNDQYYMTYLSIFSVYLSVMLDFQAILAGT